MITMKLSRSVLLLSVATAIDAFTTSSSCPAAFTRTSSKSSWSRCRYTKGDDNMSSSNDGNDSSNMWTALASTERWISETLSSSDRVGKDGKMENPYTRKEVSYVCETSGEDAMIVAGIFRRLREARELGQAHGLTQRDFQMEQEESYSPRTMRQTQVVVLSSAKEFAKSFHPFDHLVQVINQARRNARDYLTDDKLHKSDDDSDWVVSINCAHLHPKFGEKTPKQLMEEMKHEDEEGEVDLNLKAYKEKREAARRSPYPTVVIEVMSTPPPDFGASPPPSKALEDDKVTLEDVKRLEALFGKSAALDHPIALDEPVEDDDDDAFYAAIGKATGISEISLVTPTILAQNWVAQHDSNFDATTTTAFTVTDTTHVDAGYEFVFTNLAMQEHSTSTSKRQYMVMSNFVTSSATSFEKFATEAQNIISALPSLKDKIEVSTFHPEHVDTSKRSPVPIFAVDWKEES